MFGYEIWIPAWFAFAGYVRSSNAIAEQTRSATCFIVSVDFACLYVCMYEETFKRFCSIFIQLIMYQILAKSPEFCKRYYQNDFGLFFPDTL